MRPRLPPAGPEPSWRIKWRVCSCNASKHTTPNSAAHATTSATSMSGARLDGRLAVLLARLAVRVARVDATGVSFTYLRDMKPNAMYHRNIVCGKLAYVQQAALGDESS